MSSCCCCSKRRIHHQTYVGSRCSVTDQLHRQVDGSELLCKWLPSHRIGLSLTHQIIHEIHHFASGNRNSLVDQFVTSGPRYISFEMLHQTSGFGLHGLGKSVAGIDSFTATTRTGSLICLSDKTLYHCNT